ncbi:hypothetical protein F5Y16DRAFT_221496 [Xylariaceae sp. FL0255]|nr:hypothetical protein F5Y16DRAFT_221496 [Xylariaceae sp. FL0255]
MDKPNKDFDAWLDALALNDPMRSLSLLLDNDHDFIHQPQDPIPAISGLEVPEMSPDEVYPPILADVMSEYADWSEDGNLQQARAMMAMSVPDSTQLENLPAEILLQIVRNLSPHDLVTLAVYHPSVFWNPERRLDIFRLDAKDQLLVRDGYRKSLLDIVIMRFSVDIVEKVLDTYMAVHHGFLHGSLPDGILPPTDDGLPIPLTPLLERIRAKFSQRTVDLPPLWVAIHTCRLDVVKMLLRKGVKASTSRNTFPRAGQAPIRILPKLGLNSVEYAVELVLNPQNFYGNINHARNRRLEEIAIELLPYLPNELPFTRDIVPRHEIELGPSILEKAAEVAMIDFSKLLFQRHHEEYAKPENLPLLNDLKVMAARHAIRSPYPAAVELVRLFLNNTGPSVDANWGYSIFREIYFLPQIANLEAALEIMLERSIAGFEPGRPMFLQYYTDDRNLEGLQRLLPLITNSGVQNLAMDCLKEAFRKNRFYAMAPRALHWLIKTSNIIDAQVALRYAIRYRNRRAFDHLSHRIEELGGSIDDKIPYGTHTASGGVPPPSFFGTPLNWAIRSNNYYHATSLLLKGANPSSVDANLRHRVRILRDIIRREYGSIKCQELVWPAHEMILNSPTEERCRIALSYVFAKMLDDRRHPLPPRPARPLQDPSLPADHTDNLSEDDSEWSGEGYTHSWINRSFWEYETDH